ncbi:galanin peptides-like [Lissotriton helveticus]
MQRCTSIMFIALIFCVSISHTFGLVLSAKGKRGWSMQSAGYLLGPDRLDERIEEHEKSHGKNAADKHKKGKAGKRELQLEDDAKSGNLVRTLMDDNVELRRFNF